MLFTTKFFVCCFSISCNDFVNKLRLAVLVVLLSFLLDGDGRRLRLQHVRTGLRQHRQAGAADHAAGERRRAGHARADGLDVEGVQADTSRTEHAHPARDRPGVAVSCARCWSAPDQAWAADGDGQNTYANAQASGGQLTVQAGLTQWTPPAGSSWATGRAVDPPPGKPNPNQPYGCTYSDGGPSATAIDRRGWSTARPVGVPDLRRPWSHRSDAAGVGDQRPTGRGDRPGRPRGGGRAGRQAAGLRLTDDRDGPTDWSRAAGRGGDLAVDRPGRLADPHRNGDRRDRHHDSDGDAVQGGVGHGRRRTRSPATARAPRTTRATRTPRRTAPTPGLRPGSYHGDGDRVLVGDLDRGRRARRREPRASRPARRPRCR